MEEAKSSFKTSTHHTLKERVDAVMPLESEKNVDQSVILASQTNSVHMAP